MLYPGLLHFTHIADYVYDFCHLPDAKVCTSVLVCDIEHNYLHFGLCGCKHVFVCLFVC